MCSSGMKFGTTKLLKLLSPFHFLSLIYRLGMAKSSSMMVCMVIYFVAPMIVCFCWIQVIEISLG